MGIFDRIAAGADRLFGIPGEGALLPSGFSRRDARNRSLIDTGLSMLANDTPDLGRQLAQGLMAGRAGAAESLALAEQMEMAKRREVIRQKYASAPQGVESMQGMFEDLVRIGDYEGATALGQVLMTSLAKRSTDSDRTAVGWSIQNEYDPDTGMSTLTRVNARTGQRELIRDEEGNPVRRYLNPRMLTSYDSNGNPTYVQYNPNEAGGGNLPGAGGGRSRPQRFAYTGLASYSPPSEGEREAAFFLQFLPDANRAIEDLGRSPTLVEDWARQRDPSSLSGKLVRPFMSQELKAFDNGARIFAEAWLRATTGAAYNENELANAILVFTPEPGDGPELRAMKSKMRSSLMSVMASNTGRARFNDRIAISVDEILSAEDKRRAMSMGLIDSKGRPAARGGTNSDNPFLQFR